MKYLFIDMTFPPLKKYNETKLYCFCVSNISANICELYLSTSGRVRQVSTIDRYFKMRQLEKDAKVLLDISLMKACGRYI